MAEYHLCNVEVMGSSPIAGSMKNMDIFVRAERDGSISLMNGKLNVIYLTFNNRDEAVDFAVRILKFVGTLEFNDPSTWE